MEIVEAPEADSDFSEIPPPAVVAPAPAPRPRPRPQAAPARSSLEVSDELALSDWLISLAGDAEVRTNIARKKPITGPNGENISGSLETISDRFDEEYIRETWGGGTFRIRVSAVGPNGDYKFVKGGQRDIVIAGPPKMEVSSSVATGRPLS